MWSIFNLALMAACLIREQKALTLVRPFAGESHCPSGVTYKNNVRAPWIESATIDHCVNVEVGKALLFLVPGCPKTFEDVHFVVIELVGGTTNMPGSELWIDDVIFAVLN